MLETLDLIKNAYSCPCPLAEDQQLAHTHDQMNAELVETYNDGLRELLQLTLAKFEAMISTDNIEEEDESSPH